MPDPDADKLTDLLLDWEEARTAGGAPSPADLCRDCPELIGPLAERIAALERVAWLTADPAAPCPAGRAAAGDTVAGRYRLDALLAEGGQGRVWRGFDLTLGRPVAVKLPRASRLAAGLLAEARRVARLKHPGIVPVYDVAECPGGWAVVSELVDGPDLTARLRAGPMPPRAVARLMAGVAAALHHAHEQGVVHRDVKPANILLGPGDRPLLTDFGVAAAGGTADPSGTRAYMAPEQARGEPADRRADVYSLGLVLAELLTGRREPPTRPRRLARICRRCLASDQAARYPTAAALAADLTAWVGRRRRWWLLAGAGSVGVAAAAGLSLRPAPAPAPAVAEPDAAVGLPPLPPVAGPVGPDRPLFNGRDADGWTVAVKGSGLPADVGVRVADGCLTLPGSHYRLFHRDTAGDFVLRMVYRLPPGGPVVLTQLLLRMDTPGGKAPRHLRVKLAGPHAGRPFGPDSTNADAEPADGPSAAHLDGRPNTLTVVCVGTRVEATLNGRPAPPLVLAAAGSGHVGFNNGGGLAVQELVVNAVHAD